MKRKRKVVILEHDADIRYIIGYILEEQGYQVSYSGELPLEQIAALQPDLILLDEYINEREGTQICLEIKKIHKLMHIPVIILSTQPDIEQVAKDCKADGYIAKPFDLEHLVAEVERCLLLVA